MSDATVNATAAAAAEASDSVAAGTPLISLDHVTVEFGRGKNRFRAVDDVSLTINKGSIYGIIGFSGAGKSTLVRTMNVLQRPTSGTVTFNGTTISTLGEGRLLPLRRKIAMIFQHFNLMPSRTVLDNVTLPLIHEKVSRKDARAKAMHLLELVGIADKAKAYPRQLSGGQQQRVAIARALVSRPRVLLLDEPLAALDLKLRKDMQQELKNIQKATGITFVFVTHDQEEALSMSDTIVVMSEGRIQQIGTPIDIYNEPENAFVADFIGESNIVDGIMRKDFSVTFSGHTFTCVDKGFAKNENVDVVIRPEDVDIVPIEQGMLRGTVTSITFMGVHYEIIIDINGFKWMIQTTDYVDEGAEVGLYIEPDAIHIMKKSEYSGMYGDYSSFSNELDELSDAESEPDE